MRSFQFVLLRIEICTCVMKKQRIIGSACLKQRRYVLEAIGGENWGNGERNWEIEWKLGKWSGKLGNESLKGHLK